nr:caspase family protein [Novosphingobium chloroacetimidivorans]
MRFKEAFYLRLGVETACGIACQAFLYDRGDGFVAHQNAATAPALLVAIAQRCHEYPVPAEHTRPHPVLGLFAVLLALMLCNARQQMLDEDAIGVRPEFNGRGFQRRTRSEDRLFQIEVIADITRHTAYVVDDNDQSRIATGLADESEHLIEARTLRQLARHVIGENANDPVPAMLGIFAAAGFLRAEAVALFRLFLGADAAVYDCLMVYFSGHGAACLPPVLRGLLVLIAPSHFEFPARSTSSEISDFGRLAWVSAPLKA